MYKIGKFDKSVKRAKTFRRGCHGPGLMSLLETLPHWPATISKDSLIAAGDLRHSITENPKPYRPVH